MNTFSLSSWILQSITLFLGLLAAIPLLRAILGLTLIAISETFKLKNPMLRKMGIKVMPTFLRATLGLGLAIGVVNPAAADISPPEIPVIDRVIEIQATAETEVVVEQAPVIQKADSKIDSKLYVVKSGDSLWSIAKEQIVGTDATVNEIDHAWREIWDNNREVIGNNPSLIRPGLEIKLDVAAH